MTLKHKGNWQGNYHGGVVRGALWRCLKNHPISVSFRLPLQPPNNENAAIVGLLVVGPFAAANVAIFRFFPNFIVKMAKRDIANLPHLSLQSQALFKKTCLGLQSQARPNPLGAHRSHRRAPKILE